MRVVARTLAGVAAVALGLGACAIPWLIDHAVAQRVMQWTGIAAAPPGSSPDNPIVIGAVCEAMLSDDPQKRGAALAAALHAMNGLKEQMPPAMIFLEPEDYLSCINVDGLAQPEVTGFIATLCKSDPFIAGFHFHMATLAACLRQVQGEGE